MKHSPILFDGHEALERAWFDCAIGKKEGRA